MTEEDNALWSISTQLTRIADALEAQARDATPEAPNYSRPLADYPSFDWDSIGAEVVAYDTIGPTQVEWGGQVWTRRSPQNKFAEAIWYSRSVGKNADAENQYVRLISFRKAAEVDEIPARTQKALADAQAAQGHRHAGQTDVSAHPPHGSSSFASATSGRETVQRPTAQTSQTAPQTSKPGVASTPPAAPGNKSPVTPTAPTTAQQGRV